MSSKRVLIYGGKGALGDHLVNYFKSKSVVIIFSLKLIQFSTF